MVEFKTISYEAVTVGEEFKSEDFVVKPEDLETAWDYAVANEAEIDQAIRDNEQGEEGKYLDLLLYKRNRNWVAQFDTIATKSPTLFAVGAGHLPGAQGVLELLRKKGYTVKPLKN